MNPYYDATELGLEIIIFDQSNMSYEFNTLCFFSTEKGEVYTASDSGCSCPTPFERFEGEKLENILPLLERIDTVERALCTFDDWNNEIYSDADRCSISEKNTLRTWVEERLKQ